jgi:G5 domain
MWTSEQVTVRVCCKTGKRSGPDCAETEDRVFAAGTSPQQLCLACMKPRAPRRPSLVAQPSHANGVAAASEMEEGYGAARREWPRQPPPDESLAGLYPSGANRYNRTGGTAGNDVDAPDTSAGGPRRLPLFLRFALMLLCGVIVVGGPLLSTGRVRLPWPRPPASLSALFRSSAPAASTRSGAVPPARRVTLKSHWVEPIPFPIRRVKSHRLKKGSLLIKRKGKPGSRRIVAQLTYEGERKVSQRIISDEIIKPPVTMVVVSGTNMERSVPDRVAPNRAASAGTSPVRRKTSIQRTARNADAVRNADNDRYDRPARAQRPFAVARAPQKAPQLRERRAESAVRPPVRKRRTERSRRIERSRRAERTREAERPRQAGRPQGTERRRQARERVTTRLGVKKSTPRRQWETSLPEAPLPPVIEREAPLPPPL